MQESPYIDIHTHHSHRLDGVISVLNCSPKDIKSEGITKGFISVGIHPWHINQTKDIDVENLTKTALNKDVVAIGEIGLDNKIQTSMGIQKDYFIKQIEIADQLKKPVIIHCVGYFSELISIKKKMNPKTIWIVHGYRKNVQIANKLIRHNCFISFGEALLFDKKLQEVFTNIPLDKVYLETDESEHTIMEIYRIAAELRDMEIDDIKTILYRNYRTAFEIN